MDETKTCVTFRRSRSRCLTASTHLWERNHWHQLPPPDPRRPPSSLFAWSMPVDRASCQGLPHFRRISVSFYVRICGCRDAFVLGAVLVVVLDEGHQALISVAQKLFLQAIALACSPEPHGRTEPDDWVVHAPPPMTCREHDASPCGPIPP